LRVIFVLFDSLNREAMGCYDDESSLTPNIDKFASRAVTFDKHYVGSLPCMPARRDMHTGRLNFMHRAWGPLEPFDNSFAKCLGQEGIYTHLISDHSHYFEDGGAGYATSFESWDFIRGQEADPWIAMVQPPLDRFKEIYSEKQYPFSDVNPSSFTRATTSTVAWMRTRNAINNTAIKTEADFPVVKCFDSALSFIDQNKDADDWFLQIEAFDPHEPFHAPDRFRDAETQTDHGGLLNWPYYDRVTESAKEIAEIRSNYAALIKMCDENFGRLIEVMDREQMWDDTCVILTSDHGYLLSEHEWWAKNRMPYYEEISHIPLCIWHPDTANQAGTRRSAVTQTPDLMPTFLDLFNVTVPTEVTGQSLIPLLWEDSAQEKSAMFGMFAGPIGITDGKFTYYHYPDDLNGKGFNEYTLAPSRMMGAFEIEELTDLSLSPPFDFTKNIKLLKVTSWPGAKRPPTDQKGGLADAETVLFDVEADPKQTQPIKDKKIIAKLKDEIVRNLRSHDAPQEFYGLYGFRNDEVPV
jgi:arylsulfatase A-like enzyme